jgi:hypothetical protein
MPMRLRPHRHLIGASKRLCLRVVAEDGYRVCDRPTSFAPGLMAVPLLPVSSGVGVNIHITYSACDQESRLASFPLAKL